MEPLFQVSQLYSSILLQGFHYSRVEAGWSYPRHRHPLYEFIFCVKGELDQRVENETYRLREGDALLVKAGLYHQSRETTGRTEYVVFHFDVEVKEVRMILQLMKSPLISADAGPSSGASSGGEPIRERMLRLIGEFDMAEAAPDDAAAAPNGGLADRLAASVRMLRMQTHVLETICLLADDALRRTGIYERSALNPVQINRAYELACRLDTYSADKITIQDAAQHIGVDRSYLSTCFKQVYGLSPIDYYRQARIRSAKQLLQHTDLSIEAIAFRLSFSSAAHFSAYFKKTVGVSPLKYRQNV